MAVYTSILKPTAFLTVDEMAEWLNIKPEKINVPTAEIKATKIIQSLLYTSKKIGTLGNTTTIEYTPGATAGAEVVTLNVNAVSIQIEDGVSTAAQIIAAIEASIDVNPILGAILQGGATGEEGQIVIAPTLLVGGSNDVPFDVDVEKTRRLVERLINTACDKVETLIQTCVIAKPFIEILDGNNSNVIIPSKWPITEVTEVKIDYNKAFGPETIIDLGNTALRGFADKRQASTDVSLRIVGNDIALRDDNKDSFIGKIFSGSVISSIKISYKAGWAIDYDDVPYDLRHAATLLMEYYWFQRSNRDIGVSSKGIRGETYTKVKDGIPDTILELVQPYVDESLPLYEKSQTNTFDI